MKKAGMPIVALVALLFSVNCVSAENIFTSRLLGSLADVSIAQIYLRYASIVDFFLVLVIFGIVAQFAVGDKYGDKSKGLALVVGLMMALAFAFMEMKYGFNLGQLGWLAIIIFISFLVFFLFSMMTGMGADAKLSVAILFIIIYGVVSALLPQVMDWLNTSAESSFGGGLLFISIHIVLITAVVKIIISVISNKNAFK